VKTLSLLSAFLIGIIGLQAQDHSHVSARPIHFPDVYNYLTLSTDLHIHSVFSDGYVWPNIRVQEALLDGLDAIAVTEHLEYQPHSADIPHPDRNRAYHLALEEAKSHDLLIIRGSEITRGAPVGHNNAIFIEDANPLLKEKAEDSFKEARKQGAFIFWNHPAWTAQNSQGNPVLSAFQKERIKSDELHGIEVVNFGAFAEESLALALEQDLTILATSDVHGLIEWDYSNKGLQRPVTLVFAKERSLAAIHEALIEGRTVAAYNDLLIGRKEYLEPLLLKSISIEGVHYIPNTKIVELTITNQTSSDLLLENKSDYTFYESSPVFVLKAHDSKVLKIKTLEELSVFDLKFEALGAFYAPKSHPVLTWRVSVGD
jgi:predicted metal-dependent phosphoesterase TrpH